MNKITFEDLPSENTPVNANNLNQMQDNVDNAKLEKTIIVTETGTSCDDYKEDGIYWFGTSTVLPTNRPANIYGWLQVIASGGTNVKQYWHRSSTITGTSEFQTFVRFYNAVSDTWSNWKQYQMVEDTGWLDLPLNTGITQYASESVYNCKYRKIRNEVYIIGCVKGISANNTPITILPEGYRPINTYRYITGKNPTGNSILSFSTNGTLTFVGLTEGATIGSSDYVYIQTSYLVD